MYWSDNSSSSSKTQTFKYKKTMILLSACNSINIISVKFKIIHKLGNGNSGKYTNKSDLNG